MNALGNGESKKGDERAPERNHLMSTTCKILGIAGSLRHGSYNRSAVRAAAQLVPAGATMDVFELDGIPGFNQDDEQHPPARSWSSSAAFVRPTRCCW